MDIDISNANLLDEEYSNFRFLGIGKETPKQKANREFRKKLADELKKGKAKDALLTLSQRYNPAAAIPRAGVIAGFRVNIFGLATRLYPAFLTTDQLKKGNFNVPNAEKAKKGWETVSKMWRGLGGNPESLKEIIKNAHNKPIFNTKKAKARAAAEKSSFDSSEYEFSNFSGYDDAAIIAAGIGLLTAMVGLVNKSGAAKNPYDGKTIDTTGMDATTPAISVEELKAIEDAAKKDLESGKDLDSGEDLLGEDKILGMSKPLFYGGLAVIGLGTTIFILWKKGVFK